MWLLSGVSIVFYWYWLVVNSLAGTLHFYMVTLCNGHHFHCLVNCNIIFYLEFGFPIYKVSYSSYTNILIIYPYNYMYAWFTNVMNKCMFEWCVDVICKCNNRKLKRTLNLFNNCAFMVKTVNYIKQLNFSKWIKLLNFMEWMFYNNFRY